MTVRLPPRVVSPVPFRVRVVLFVPFPSERAEVLAAPRLKVPDVGLIVDDAPKVKVVVAPIDNEAPVVKVVTAGAEIVVPLTVKLLASVKLPELVNELFALKKLILPVLVSPNVKVCLAVVAKVPLAER